MAFGACRERWDGPRRTWVIGLGALATWLALTAAGAESARAASASAVSAGYQHTCSLTTSGGVECWGSNQYGQLGDGTTTNSNVPVAVSGLSSGVAAVAVGWFHSCALTTGGGVQCWGTNYAGQLGDGTNTDSTVPVAVSGLSSGVAAISTGVEHTCALTTGGGVECWGSITGYNSFPLPVDGLSSGVGAIASGYGYSCALTTGGGVQCWGANAYGQLGDGTTTTAYFPVAVSGLSSGVMAVSAEYNHTCAVTAGGAVKCWGQNGAGQLGNGTTSDSSIPVPVSGLSSGAASIAAGEGHTCAVTTGGGVQCWGGNFYGALGDGTTTQSNVPVAVSGFSSGVAAVSAGVVHTCAVTTSGALRCWGDNTYGQLGVGIDWWSSLPAAVIGLPGGISLVAAGSNHTCALTAGGGVQCWGENFYGALGNATTQFSPVPVAVNGLSSGVVAVSPGQYYTCALTTGGGVQCWGYNFYGQLGNGTTTNSSIPVAVSGLSSGAAAVSAGGQHTCALTTGGGVKCWGYNFSGHLGNGTNTSSSVPVAVSGLSSGAAAVSAGAAHSCALTTAGAVRCWGRNFEGQLGNGTTTNSNVPVAVSGLSSGVAAVSAGGLHTCALTTGGGVKCWGQNSNGQLGNGTTTNSNVPVAVVGLSSGVAAVSAGGQHTCALTTGGGMQCWGANFNGALGNGTLTQSNAPVVVSGLSSGVTAVAAGFFHNCALTTGDGLKCWGRNNYGQLGNGISATMTVPVGVIGFTGNGPAVVPALGLPALGLLAAGLGLTGVARRRRRH